MAFILDNLTNIRGQDKADRVQGKYMYRTTDSRATVLANNYFLNAATVVPSTDTTTTTSTGTQRCVDKFYSGDILEIQEVDANDLVLDEYVVVVAVIDKSSAPLMIVELINAGEIVAVGTLTDISTASNVDIVFGQEVDLTSVNTYLGGVITVGNAAITLKEDSSSGTNVDGGTLTVAFSGSAKGDKDSASPYANRTATTFNVASDGGSTGTQTLTVVLRGRVVAAQVETFTLRVADISTASSADAVVAPIGGTIVRIQSTLQGAITVGDAVLTTKIGTAAAGVAITGGAITIANASSAAGDVDTATPTAANVLAEGDLISVISDGGSTDAAAAYVTFHVLR